MQKEKSIDPQEIEIIQKNETLVVSSLEVARHFGKRHSNVIRAIRRIISECCSSKLDDFKALHMNFEPLSFSRLNFEPRDYQDDFGRIQPVYLLTRDGFSLLAMGFTGKEAFEWKIRYIAAFNRMEHIVKQERQWVNGLVEGLHRLCPPPPVEDNSVRRWRAIKILRGVTAYWAMLDGLDQEVAEKTVCTVGNIRRLDDFQVEDGTYNKMLLFLFRAIARSKDDDVAATGQQIMTIKYLIEACTQFKYSRNNNIYDHLKNIYNIDAEQILTASKSEAKRIAATVYAIMFQQIQTCVVLGELNEVAGNLVERNVCRPIQDATAPQGGKS